MKPIRNSAKAIIIENDQVLLTKNEDDFGFFYLYPGGGQEKNEQLRDAVIRECVEEIGREVRVHDLLHVREYIGQNHEFAEWDGDIHQVEFYFACTLVGAGERMEGRQPDADQVGVEWMPIDRLDEIRVYPKELTKYIRQGQAKPCYLGDTD